MEIEDILNDTITKNKLIVTKKGLYVKNYYKDILHKYGIEIDDFSTYQDIIFMINDFLNNNDDLDDEEYEELDTIATEIADKNYYENFNK